MCVAYVILRKKFFWMNFFVLWKKYLEKYIYFATVYKENIKPVLMYIYNF